MLHISTNIYHRIVFVSLYVIIMFAILDYKALYKYCILLLYCYHIADQDKRNQNQTRGAQPANSRQTCMQIS